MGLVVGDLMVSFDAINGYSVSCNDLWVTAVKYITDDDRVLMRLGLDERPKQHDVRFAIAVYIIDHIPTARLEGVSYAALKMGLTNPQMLSRLIRHYPQMMPKLQKALSRLCFEEKMKLPVKSVQEAFWYWWNSIPTELHQATITFDVWNIGANTDIWLTENLKIKSWDAERWHHWMYPSP